jgi:Fe-S-cluster-containing dehydrogenase component/DMSO reductase anchor subunit
MSSLLVADKTLLDQLLEEQQTVAPAEKFAQMHEDEILGNTEQYRELIPLSEPSKNEQYAFQVNIDQCTGCKGCVTACHSLNGLDKEETWRDVGMLYGGDQEAPYIQTVTTACHHCIDPGCLNGCPVEAYEKDPITGIVAHLDDQCIGCQYCVLKCPYDVPKYNQSKGIVRKCDLCQNRLAIGEAPACVQACPNEAIQITLVDVDQITSELKENGDFLPGTPDPSYTIPSTQYKSKNRLPDNLKAADFNHLKAENSHMPLVIMLTLTQICVGLFVGDTILRLNDKASSNLLIILSTIIGFIGLGASFIHLGQPLKAWRFFLGLKRSWLSREILAFNLFIPSLLGLVLALHYESRLDFVNERNLLFLSIATSVTGLISVFCSVMIYHDTKRIFWNIKFSGLRFFGTTALFAFVAYSFFIDPTSPIGPICLIITATIKFGLEASLFKHLKDHDTNPLKKTALISQRIFPKTSLARFGFLLLGGIMLPTFALINMDAYLTIISMSTFFLVIGELVERYLFFTTVSAPKMPGNI